MYQVKDFITNDEIKSKQIRVLVCVYIKGL